jgi:peptide/nickel transport system substrate-binding protein
VYQGLADPIWGHVTPGNRLWINRDIPRPARSLENARDLLRSASFWWKDGSLQDPEGNPVTFSILVSSSNVQRAKIATIVQDDLRQLGMKVSVVSLESRTMLDRIFNRLDYDAALMALDSSDVDPNSEMNVWLAGGSLHLWNLNGTAQNSWEEEIDRLMRSQMTVLDRSERKRMYDRVQQLVAEHLPFICLASPHVLVGASDRLGNLHPSILSPYALWNSESLHFREE